MDDRVVYNFSAGPSQMPLEVLEAVQMELENYDGSSKEYTDIAAEAEKNLRDIYGVPDDYTVFFAQGGATLTFASSVPLNMLGPELLGAKPKADYVVTGQCSEKASQECKRYGVPNEVCNTRGGEFTSIPDVREWKVDPEAAYVHYCANEAVNGVEFGYTPDVGDVPLVADMSSNFLSKPVDVSKHAFIYSGAQKNLGPAGISIGILHPKFADGSSELKTCPTYRSFKVMADNGSMYNTPAMWHVIGEYLRYTKRVGGVEHWADMSDKKAGLLYGIIDDSSGFYNCPVERKSRSRINVPFTIMGGDEAVEKKFLDEAKKQKLFLAGHRCGGCHASLYNSMPLEGVEKLGDFMKSFMDENRE